MVTSIPVAIARYADIPQITMTVMIMRVIVEADMVMSEKMDGEHYVHDIKCKEDEFCCFSFSKDGITNQCQDFKRLLTGVKICGRR